MFQYPMRQNISIPPDQIMSQGKNVSIPPDQNMSQGAKLFNTFRPKYVPGRKMFQHPHIVYYFLRTQREQ